MKLLRWFLQWAGVVAASTTLSIMFLLFIVGCGGGGDSQVADYQYPAASPEYPGGGGKDH